MDNTRNSMTDHDLLIKLNENVTSMREEMRQNNQTTTATFTDHEARIRVLEQSQSTQTGSSSGIRWLVGLLIALGGLFVAAISVMITIRTLQ